MVEISLKEAFGLTSFAGMVTNIAIFILQAIYNDLFSHVLENDPLLWMYAFGGIVLILGMSVLASALFIDSGSKGRAILVIFITALIIFIIFTIWGIIYDEFCTTAFIHYQWYDWITGIPYVLSYFAMGQFGSIPTFWNVCSFIYWAILPFLLKLGSVQKKVKYLKTRVAKNGW